LRKKLDNWSGAVLMCACLAWMRIVPQPMCAISGGSVSRLSKNDGDGDDNAGSAA
jgi:hypothetical protein